MTTAVFLGSENLNHGETLRGLAMSLGSVNMDSILWQKHQKPVFDMLHELRPKALFCSSFDIDNDILNALDEYKDTRLVAIGYRPEIQLTKNCLICYETEKPEDYIAYHLEPAANTAAIGGSYNEIYKCDIMSICEQKPSIINTILADYQIKLFSFFNHIQDDYRYLGKIPLNMFGSLVRSSKVFLEEHGSIHNLMNALANGGSVLTKNKIFLKNDSIKVFNEENIEEILEEAIVNKNDNSDCQFDILKNHTYLNRLSDIMNILGHTKEASLCKKQITNLV